MTNAEAIETLRANYPDACFEQLREAVDAAIEALKAQDVAGDTIYKQAAIDALIKADYEFTGILSEPRVRMFEQTINALPPAQPDLSDYSDKLWRAAYERGKKEAQPEIIRCKDCRYYQDNNNGYPHMNCKWDANETPDADDFCSAAERRNDGIEQP